MLLTWDQVISGHSATLLQEGEGISAVAPQYMQIARKERRLESPSKLCYGGFVAYLVGYNMYYNLITAFEGRAAGSGETQLVLSGLSQIFEDNRTSQATGCSHIAYISRNKNPRKL